MSANQLTIHADYAVAVAAPATRPDPATVYDRALMNAVPKTRKPFLTAMRWHSAKQTIERENPACLRSWTSLIPNCGLVLTH
jgi:hypothetical protein